MNAADIKRLFPNASRSVFEANCEVSNAEPERHKTPALDKPVSRKTEGTPSVTVRFIGRRVRPLDPDNFAGSVKDLLDGLRHASLLLGDEPWRIRLETEQIRVSSYAQESTEIILIYV